MLSGLYQKAWRDIQPLYGKRSFRAVRSQTPFKNEHVSLRK